MASSSRCANCGSILDAEDRFCPTCGQPAPPPPAPPPPTPPPPVAPLTQYCTNCRAEIGPRKRFCTACGQAVAGTPRPPWLDPAPGPGGPPGGGGVPPRPAPLGPQGPVALRYAGVWSRFAALLLDGVMLVCLQGAVVDIIGRGGAISGEAGYGFAVLLYFLLCEAFLGGTLGKGVMGLRIVNSAGQSPGLLRALARTLLRPIDAFPGVIPYLLGAVLVANSRTKQRLGDRVGGTYVVSDASLTAVRRARAASGI